MAYRIISQDGSQVLKQTFETVEEAQYFLENSSEFPGMVITTEQLEQYLQERAQYQQQQQQPQYEQEPSYGPDQSEEEYLAENKRKNDYNREKKLLYIPKRENPIWHSEPFNARPAGHSFNHPPINQQNFHPPEPRAMFASKRPFWIEPFRRY